MKYQKISEVFLEEGEAGATRRANQIGIFDAFSRQCFSNDGGSAQEDTNVLALVLVTVLLEDTTPIWPPKELASCAGEFLHLCSLQNLIKSHTYHSHSLILTY